MNIKTGETNQQVIDRIEAAYIKNVENAGAVDNNVLDGEMRKLILKRGKQIFARKTVSTKEFLQYVDNTAKQLVALQQTAA